MTRCKDASPDWCRLAGLEGSRTYSCCAFALARVRRVLQPAVTLTPGQDGAVNNGGEPDAAGTAADTGAAGGPSRTSTQQTTGAGGSRSTALNEMVGVCQTLCVREHSAELSIIGYHPLSRQCARLMTVLDLAHLFPSCFFWQWVELDPSSWVWLSNVPWVQIALDLGTHAACQSTRRVDKVRPSSVSSYVPTKT